jgi:hypothetical protein
MAHVTPAQPGAGPAGALPPADSSDIPLVREPQRTPQNGGPQQSFQAVLRG